MSSGPHSQTAMRAIALSALAAAGLPAGAMAPPMPPCIDETLAPEERAIGWYHFDRLGPDVVAYALEGNRRDELRYVVEHCPTRQRMVADVPFAANQGAPHFDTSTRVGDAIRAAVAAPEVYTMRDLGRIAREAGARRARVTRVDFESCGCRLRND